MPKLTKSKSGGIKSALVFKLRSLGSNHSGAKVRSGRFFFQTEATGARTAPNPKDITISYSNTAPPSRGDCEQPDPGGSVVWEPTGEGSILNHLNI